MGAAGAQFQGFSNNLGNIGIVPEAGLPIHAAALLRAIQNKFDIYGYPETEITIEELERSKDNDEKGEDKGKESEN